jgi:pyruvate dehydrogenase E2 component (dihydrolipoamide acetyltransferase)
MATEVIIPSYGTSQEEVQLISWKKDVGEPVARGDALCELETDKAVTELEAFADGVLLARLIEPGQDVRTGQVIAYIGQAGEKVPDPPTDATPSEAGGTAPASNEARTPPGETSEPPAGPTRPHAPAGPGTGAGGVSPRPAPDAVRASPLVRRLAREQGVDLASVSGTGPGGRITKEDVQRAAASGG